MTRKELAGVGLGGLLLLAAFSGCRERGRPDPNIRMAVSHEREETAGNPEASTTPPVPNKLEVPPEVAQTYSGIKIHWKDSTGGKEGTLDVPLEGTARIPGSELDVRAEVFLPAFTMTAQAITSKGVDPANPAAHITVLEKGKEIFAGWIFTRFPDVHPFEHPRYSLRLDGGVPRKAS